LTVIDCSAMIELLAAKTHTGDAIARRVASAQALYAPYVLDGEVIFALLGLRRGQKISEREADAALSSYRAFPVERQDVLPLWPRLRSLHADLSAYDAQYVALAEALDVPLVTADSRIKTRRHSTMQGRNLRHADLTGGVRGRLRVAGGAGGARTHDRRIMRSMARRIVRTTCTDTTEPCRRWP
jgi:predicted nucleic acid-binding protein